ncbi:hypothetical protein EYF80_007916 [Liparis tanakae]|uniref:Uncharacterized protein n=1 Tax=Liparis tanakae TaxID=230148 RepID=A0A4Z2IVK8_9TELE|nr:hypothetical protein EYF80_007916 [Liparis tanakae]
MVTSKNEDGTDNTFQNKGFRTAVPDRDRAAAERDSLPLISGSPPMEEEGQRERERGGGRTARLFSAHH